MDRHDKLLERLRRRPRDFTWEELTTLLRRLGFRQVRPGRTAGSRRRFIHPDGCVISLHEPHPARILKGLNEMDPPLCGMALISHHEVSASDPHVTTRRRVP